MTDFLRRLIFCAALLWPLGSLAQSGAVSEVSMKAVLLFRLPQFVYWPQNEKPPAVLLCVQGNPAFSRLLQQLVHSSRANTEIRSVELNSGYVACDLLFVSRSESAQLETILQQADARRLLTVSDIPGFVRAGGMVELVMLGDKVGVSLNRRAAQKRGFDFNAQLLSLAQRVEQ